MKKRSVMDTEEGSEPAGSGVELMKQRYQLEDADRRAYLKNSLLAFQHLEEERKQLTKDIKDAREQLLNQKHSIRGGASSTSTGFFRPKENKMLQKYKMILNSKKNETSTRLQKLKKLRSKMEELQNERGALGNDNNPYMQTIRHLENKLDKAMIKYNEAMSIRKTYEMIVKRLQDERVGYDNQLAAIEKNLKGKEHDYEELLLLEHDAKFAQKEEEDKLLEFKRKQNQYDECKKKEMDRQRKALERAMVEQQAVKEEQEEQQEQRDELRRKKLEQSKKRTETESKKHESNLEKMKEELVHFKRAFQEIKEATGVGDVNDVSEIIQKFMTQDDTLNGLKNVKDEKSRKLESLSHEREVLQSKVNKYKYEGAQGITKKQSEEIEKHIQASKLKLERGVDKFLRLNQIAVDVQAGVEHLYNGLRPLKGDSVPLSEITEDRVTEAVAQCEEKLLSLYAAMKKNPEIMSILEEKVFMNAEKKQMAIMATQPHIGPIQEADDLDLSDRDQREEMAQQLNERNKLKHEALNRYEKKLKQRTKKPRTAVGGRRTFNQPIVDQKNQ